MFFQSWDDLLRVFIVGVLAYIGLVFLLRLSGKRTLSKFNMFDMVVTIALGSTLSTVLITREIPLLDGLVGFATLILMQYIVAFFSVRSARWRNLVKDQPALVFYRGEYLWKTLKHERVTEGEVRAAIRDAGFGSVEEVEAVVLETDGTLNAVAMSRTEKPTALIDTGQKVAALR